MSQALQTVFHGINRSPAVETAVAEKVEALRRFDNQLGLARSRFRKKVARLWGLLAFALTS